MNFDRFDFEQQLLDVWGITDDLDVVVEAVLERDITKDQIANILLGMKELYEIKFNKLWDQFENGVHQHRIVGTKTDGTDYKTKRDF